METLPGDQGWGKPFLNLKKIKAIFQELQGFFHASTGHAHTGTADDGPQLDKDGLAADALAADATGRAIIEAGYFDETTVDDLVAAGAIDYDRLKQQQAYDPGRAAIGALRVASDVVEAQTVTIGADVYEIEVVNTDSTDDTADGDFNNTTDPLTVDMSGYTNLSLSVGDLVRIENEIMAVTVVDGDNITFKRGVSGTTAATHADALDIFTGDGIVTGIAVGLVVTLTPAVFTDALIDDINGRGTENVLAVDISDNEVLVCSADAPGGNEAVGAITLALAETLLGANNVWDSANMRGGRAAGVRKVVVVAREALQTEVDLGNMHFVFDFAPTLLKVEVFTDTYENAGGAVPIAWAGAATITGNRIVIDNAGGTDWAAGSLVVLTVTD